MTKTQKLIVITASFFIALQGYFLAYAHFSSKLTSWQKEQDVDVFAQTGATKFQAYVNSMSVAGVCFVVSAAILLLAIKFLKTTSKNEQK